MTERAAVADGGSVPARGGHDWAIYRRLLKYVRPMWPYFLIALIGFGLGSAAEAYFARLFGDVVEALSNPGNTDWTLFPALIMAVVLVRGLGEFAGEYFLSRVSYRVVHTIRCELFDQLLAMPSSFFDRSARGHLVSRLTFNVAQLRDTATDALKTALQDGSKVAVLLGAMLFANWKLTLIFLIITPLVATVVTFASRRFRRISRRIQHSMGDVTHVASETVNAYHVVRIFGGEAYERARFNRFSDDNQRQNLKMIATKAWSTQVVQVFVAGALALLIGLLFQPDIAGDMSAGDVVYFLGLAGLLARPIKKLSEVSSRLQRGLAAAEDVFSQLDQDTEIDVGTVTRDRVRGEIEFRNVSFAYEGSATPVLDDVNLTIAPGQRVALVGRSGGGKTTLASLIPRFYEPSKGEILLDGVPLPSYRLRSLRDQIALVNQQVVLFNDTLERNIAYGGLSGASTQDISDAARRAHADGFIAALPEGLATIVGDDGVLLSGGQRQRIAIARALLKNAPILILDEATSALDTESEKSIQAALEEVMRGRTTLVIAHRLSTIETADLILVMDGGRIVERGTHRELLDRKGVYAKLHEVQFDDQAGSEAPPPLLRTPKRATRPPVERLAGQGVWVRAWYGNARWVRLLAPLSWIFRLAAERRRMKFVTGMKAPWRASVPVIVVGNLTVGGTGKTPLVIHLVRWLMERGFRPGVVSRGYGGGGVYPMQVDSSTAASEAGDEAPLIARRTRAPVVVDPDRVAAVRQLLDRYDCDVVIADDGLQHYALARDLEIVVLDGDRGIGNGRCLPAGPLREPKERLESVDLVIANGRATGLVSREFVMTDRATALVAVVGGERRPVEAFARCAVHAAAGIGNPARFFDRLSQLEMEPIVHPFPDHQVFKPSDLAFGDQLPVVVTEKDAVKLVALDPQLLPAQLWYLEMEVALPADGSAALAAALDAHGIRPRPLKED